jgi:uncharacterized protein DUF3467
MAEEKPKGPKGPRLQVQIDEPTAHGMYSNVVLINHSENEFVLDFGFVPPGTQVAKVRARVVVTPRHAKRLLKALEHNVSRYEAHHGVIDTSPRPGEVIVN